MKTELIKTETTVKVSIPTLDGKAVAEVVKLTVPCLKDPVSGEEFLKSEAMDMMDQTKARYMGLLLPEEIKNLRQSLSLTQSKMSELLQIGAKSYSRWETGRARPSRSINLLLRALADGKVTPSYLRSKHGPFSDWWALAFRRTATSEKRKAYTMNITEQSPCNCMEEGGCYETKQSSA